MKFVRKLLGKPEPKPTWDIKPAEDRPAPREREPEVVEQVLDVSPEVDPWETSANEFTTTELGRMDELPQEEKHPWLDDETLDTIQLEASDLPEDIYNSGGWDQTFENDTRRLKTIQIGSNTDHDATGAFNPYDTGSMRKGWKK
jgi:hypothetical protein